MDFESWRAFYSSQLQQVYLLWVVPALCLPPLWVAARRAPASGPGARDARFVRLYCLWFCLETLLDPFATGPGAKLAGLGETASTLVMFTFVWLGDFRVLLLVFTLSRPRGAADALPLGRAALVTCAVPVVAGSIYRALGWLWPEVPSQMLWILYEAGFLGLALFLRARVVPTTDLGDPARARATSLLRDATAYVATYYALWLTSDLLIVIADADWGWALRVVPNQLYYSFWIPFVYARYFWAGPGSASPAS